MNELEKKIGYKFSNPALLETALTHSSFANEHDVKSYERLEFLGDSVLGFVSAEFLYNHSPEISEGRMTKIRSEKVCSVGLSNAAKLLELGKYIKMSHGEERCGGRNRRSNLEDVMESLIGAIYLDSGMEQARIFVKNFVLKDIDFDEKAGSMNFKGALQEILQKNGEADIRYEEISASGPDHDRTFECRVLFNSEEIGRGTGKSKREAEQKAAGEAIKKING